MDSPVRTMHKNLLADETYRHQNHHYTSSPDVHILYIQCAFKFLHFLV